MWVEGAARERRIALGVDAFRQPQTHQQKFVGALFPVQGIVGDDAMAIRFDPHQPRHGSLFSGDGVPDAGDIEPRMRARPDAGILLAAPVHQIMPAFRTSACMIGNLVCRLLLEKKKKYLTAQPGPRWPAPSTSNTPRAPCP